VIAKSCAALLAVAVVVSLVSCAGSDDAPGSRPAEGTTSPTASAFPVASAPSQRFDLRCEQLLPATDATALFESGVTLQSDMTGIESLSGPRGNAVRQLGGLVCLWSDGRRYPPADEAQAPGVWVTVRPDAEQQWAKYASTYGESALALRCGTEEPPVTCLGEYGVHGYWIEIKIRGVVANHGESAVEAVTPLVDRIRSAVAALPEPRDPWSVPANAASIPSDCEAFLPIATVKAALRQTKPIVYSVGDGWSLPGTIQTDAHYGGCFVGTTEQDDILVGTEWLAGGAWAFDREVAPRLAAGKAKAVAVDGLRDGDAAALSCDDAADTCAIDLRVGGNWVRSTVFLSSTSAFSSDDRRAAVAGLPALGAAIVATLAG